MSCAFLLYFMMLTVEAHVTLCVYPYMLFCVCILFVHVENCGVQIGGGVTSEQRIKRSCEVSHTARTDFGEPECMFVRTQCNKSADSLQPLPQFTKWDWKKWMEIHP